jgi:CheY-like chemotaxis protein
MAFNSYDVDNLTSPDHIPDKPSTKLITDEPIDAFKRNQAPNMGTDEDILTRLTVSPSKYSSVTIYKTLGYLELMKKFYKLDYNFPRFPNVHHHLNQEDQPNTISQLKQSKDGFLKIEVKDTGCGMNEVDLHRLFKRFSQVGSVAVHRQIGTGLGLWITHSLCEGMGGSVKAYSEPGKGSTFVAVMKSQAAASNKGKGGFKIQKAMVVDDIVTNQKLNSHFLERYGVQVADIASNGLEAFESYTKKGDRFFDLIFMDIDMPVMSGSEATEKIRVHEKKYHWKPVLIAIITGACTKAECDRFLDPKGSIRANYVFQKPFSLHQCRDLIEQLNNQSRPSHGDSNDHKTSGNNSSQKIKRKVVLIVDDDKFNVKLLSDYLNKQKIETIVANNGKNAIEKYKQFYLDIKMIFMDCEMPVMNGLEATRIIRTLIDDNIWPDLKIVGLTGNATDESKLKCKKAGMNSVITKPISYSILQNTIDSFYFA